MLKTLVVAFVVVMCAPPGGQSPGALMAPLENVRDPLRAALSSLQHAANQTCDVKKAIVDIRSALNELSASAAFLNSHADARGFPPLPPDISPTFTPPPRPAPRRNEMLEGALKNLGTAFRRLSDANGGDFDGHRDKAYHHIGDASAGLITAINAANEAFRGGRRELPSCDPDGRGDR